MKIFLISNNLEKSKATYMLHNYIISNNLSEDLFVVTTSSSSDVCIIEYLLQCSINFMVIDYQGVYFDYDNLPRLDRILLIEYNEDARLRELSEYGRTMRIPTQVLKE